MTLDAPVHDEPLQQASFGQAYLRFWQRFVVLSGRASRSELWWAVLGNALVLLGLALLLVAAVLVRGALDGSPLQAIPGSLVGVLAVLAVLVVLAQLVPSIAVSVRRLHDADLPGWLVLVVLVPSVGGLILLVLHLLPSDPRGSRYDRGADAARRDGTPPALTGTAPVEAFDAWPAADPANPFTLPLAVPAAGGPSSDTALRTAWSALGAVVPLEPPMSAPPAWRSQGYLLVAGPDGTGVLTTDGLSGREGAAALGPGAEVHLADAAFADGSPIGVAEGWRFAAVAAVARRIGASGLHLPSELERYGTLSMTLPDVAAPEGLRTAEGGLGVLLGLPHAGVPETVVTPGGEVRLVSITPLTPGELQQILDGGASARARVAGRLAALPAAALAARIVAS